MYNIDHPPSGLLPQAQVNGGNQLNQKATYVIYTPRERVNTEEIGKQGLS